MESAAPGLQKMLSEYVTINYENILLFCLSNPYTAIIDAGARYVEEFQPDVETSLKEIYKEVLLIALKVEAGKMNAGDCLECGQCMPWCEYKLNIPKMMKQAHEVLSGR